MVLVPVLFVAGAACLRVLLVLLVLSYGWCCMRTMYCLCCVCYVLALVLAPKLMLQLVMGLLSALVLLPLAQVPVLALLLAQWCSCFWSEGCTQRCLRC